MELLVRGLDGALGRAAWEERANRPAAIVEHAFPARLARPRSPPYTYVGWLSRVLKEGFGPLFFPPKTATNRKMDRENPFRGELEETLRGAVTALGLELCHLGWKPRPPRHADPDDRPRGGRHARRLRAGLARRVRDPRRARGLAPVVRPRGRVARPRPPALDARGLRPVPGEARDGRASTARWRGRRGSRECSKTIAEDRLTVLDEDRQRRYTVPFGDVKLARLVPEL